MRKRRNIGIAVCLLAGLQSPSFGLCEMMPRLRPRRPGSGAGGNAGIRDMLYGVVCVVWLQNFRQPQS